RPHFLFNSINAVLSLIRQDPKRAETALEDMADLFRLLMADNRNLSTPERARDPPPRPRAPPPPLPHPRPAPAGRAPAGRVAHRQDPGRGAHPATGAPAVGG